MGLVILGRNIEFVDGWPLVNRSANALLKSSIVLARMNKHVDLAILLVTILQGCSWRMLRLRDDRLRSSRHCVIPPASIDGRLLRLSA